MEILGILSKVKGEITLSHCIISRRAISIMAISATLCISSILYSVNEPNAYEICINKKVIAYINNDKKDLDLVNNIVEELSSRFSTLKLKNSITINTVKINEELLTDDSLIKKSIVENSGILVDAYAMTADGREFAVVASEEEGKNILENVKNNYITKSGLEVKSCVLKTNIKYVKKKVLMPQIDEIDIVVNRIKAVNEKAQSQLVAFELKGIKESSEAISPSIDIKWSEEMTVGQSKLLNNGIEGKKSVTKEIQMINSKVLSTRITSEKTVVKPINKVVLQGSKSPGAVAAGTLFIPSRGTISSGFGMRWGKMHEGLDIAANMGDPIYAALDGKVIYSAWETGYGNVIKLQHDNGLITIYGHCSKLVVTVGQYVKKGDEIALVGSTGNSTGPHLHFEVRVNGVAQNPVAFLSK